LAQPSSNFARPGKSETGKSRLFNAFYKHLSGPYTLVCRVSLCLSSSSRYPVATGNAAILLIIAPNSRLVRWLSANSSQ